MALHGDSVAGRTAHARALIDNVRLQRDKKKVVKEKETFPRLLAAENDKEEGSAVWEQVRKEILTVTMKLSEQIGVLAASLEVAKKVVFELRKNRDAVIRELRKKCARLTSVLGTSETGCRLCSSVPSVIVRGAPTMSIVCKAVAGSCNSL